MYCILVWLLNNRPFNGRMAKSNSFHATTHQPSFQDDALDQLQGRLSCCGVYKKLSRWLIMWYLKSSFYRWHLLFCVKIGDWMQYYWSIAYFYFNSFLITSLDLTWNDFVRWSINVSVYNKPWNCWQSNPCMGNFGNHCTTVIVQFANI